MEQTDALTSAKKGIRIDADTYIGERTVMLGESNLSVSGFTNKGSFAAQGSVVRIDAEKWINNNGLLSIEGELILHTGELDNTQGRIESSGTLSVTSDSLLMGGGTLFTENALILVSAIKEMDSHSHILSKGGIDLTFLGNTQTEGEIIANALGDADSFITVKGDLTNGAKINTGGFLGLKAKNVTNTARIQSAGDMRANLGGRLNNSDFFTAGGKMDISTESLTNSGGIASGRKMTIETDRDLANTQTIYAAGDMDLFVKGRLKNTKEIYSGGDLLVAADKQKHKSEGISNINGVIESAANMALYTKLFENIGQAAISYTKKYFNLITKTEMTEEEMLAWMDKRDDPSPVYSKWHRSSIRRLIKEWFEKRDLLKIATENNGGIVPASKNESGSVSFTEFETHIDGSAATVPAYVVSGANMYVNADTIYNKDAIIASGNNMHFDAGTVQNVPSSIEVPTEEVVHNISWSFKHHTFKDNKGQVYLSEYIPQATGSTIIESTSDIIVGGTFSGNIGNFKNGASSTLFPLNIKKPDLGVDATDEERGSIAKDQGYLTHVNFTGTDKTDIVSQRGTVDTVNRGRDTEAVDSPGHVDEMLVTKLDITPSIYNPQEHLSLPKSPYGIFITNPKPTGPLIEFNPEYVNYNNYISSDYMLEHLGFKGKNTTRRLGDGMYIPLLRYFVYCHPYKKDL
jgi:filamentous hemagglutinin